MYRVGRHERGKRHRIIIWLVIATLLLGLGWWGWSWVRQQLQPKTTIKQAPAITTKVSYGTTTKQYTEPDFTISLPSIWQAVPRPPGPYQSYTWQTSDSGTDGQQIQIFEDTIPANFAVNRALVVSGEVDHLAIDGSASDNCSSFTGNAGAKLGETGVLAKWQGVSFICDQSNQQRDVIGTTSTDGINTVLLENQDTGIKHKFLFAYTNHSVNPDYTVFYNVLQSLHMN